jgi:trk system potassium uptake protein
VVYPEQEMGTGIAYVLTLGNIIDYIPVTTGYGVVKMTVPVDFAGKSLGEAGFGQRGRIDVIVLILQRKQELIINPGAIEIIRPDDVLVISGNWEKLEELFSRFQKIGAGK